MSNKCKYYNCCTLYNANDTTCNELQGCYYGFGRYAGCARELAAKGKKAYCYKEPLRLEMAERKQNIIAWIALGILVLALVIFTITMLIM